MARFLYLKVICLMTIFFITGCPRPETPPAEPAQPMIAPVEEPAELESPDIEPETVEPEEIAPEVVETEEPEQGEIAPEPEQSEPVEVKSEPVQPETAEPPEPEVISAADFHDKCAAILADFVSDEGMVNYKMLKRKKSALTKLLAEFRNLDPNEYKTWPKEDKIAFWINTYNIQMLDIIVGNYPIQSSRVLRLFWHPNSIRHIKGLWDKHKFIVMNEEFTLSQIEKKFLRTEFDEPRVFLAISQASLSSPPLRNKPYYGKDLNSQLDEQTIKFLTSPLAFEIDREEQEIRLSAIFQETWYGEEFVSRYGTDKRFKDHKPAVRAVLNFLTNYLPKKQASYLELQSYSVEYLSYDWRLNE